MTKIQKTKANVPAPPPRNKIGQKAEYSFGLLDAPAPKEETPSPAQLPALPADDNMGRGKPMRDLNFLVPVAFHNRFKTEAVKRDMKMKDMLYQMFEQWVRDHPAGVDQRAQRAEPRELAREDQ